MIPLTNDEIKEALKTYLEDKPNPIVVDEITILKIEELRVLAIIHYNQEYEFTEWFVFNPQNWQVLA